MEFLEEKHEHDMIRNTTYKQRVACYFDKRVRERKLRIGDLMLKRVFLKLKKLEREPWEGPYKITEELRHKTYRLATMGGLLIPRA